MGGKLEQLFGPIFRGMAATKANSSTVQFAGITTLNSGSTTVTVSTTLVKSDSLFFLGTQAPAAVGSATGKPIEVKTVIDSSYFVLGTADGVAMGRDTNISWMLYRQN